MEENDREFETERLGWEAEVDRLERKFIGCRVRHFVTGEVGIATAVGFKRGCPDPVAVVRWDAEDDPSACAPALLVVTRSRAGVFSAARDAWGCEPFSVKPEQS